MDVARHLKRLVLFVQQLIYFNDRNRVRSGVYGKLHLDPLVCLDLETVPSKDGLLLIVHVFHV